MATAPRKNLAFWGVRLTGSAVMLGVLFWILPADAILDALPRIPIGVFCLVFLLFLCSHAAAAAKWWLLLGRAVPFPLALKAHFAGLAANLCLPGAIGGDAVRAAMVHGAMRDLPRLAVASIADRVIDMIALTAISGVAVLGLSSGSVHSVLLTKAIIAIGLLVVGVIWGVPRLLPLLWTLAPKLPARDLGLKIAAALRELGRRPAFFGGILLFSLAIQTTLVSLSWWLALGTGLQVGFAEWSFAWPLAKILAVLPISLGGLGLREMSLAGLLAPFGVDASLVVAAGLAWQGVLWLAGGLGAVVQVLPGHGQKRTEEKSAG